MSIQQHYHRMHVLVCLQEIFFKFTTIQVENEHKKKKNKFSWIDTLILDDWDCVATCFFIDTAHNIIEYVERLHKILKKGGIWINFGLWIDKNKFQFFAHHRSFVSGPLLYHFEDIPNESSFEISYDDLRSVIESCGFKIEVRFLFIGRFSTSFRFFRQKNFRFVLVT